MKVLLKNANLITMRNDQISYHTDLLMEDGKIAAIGKNLRADSAKQIDCEDKYLLSGLIDSHVHYNSSEMGELLFANGITSVRNMQGVRRHLEYAREIRSGSRVGPYLYSTGQIYDGEQTWTNLTVIRTMKEAEAAVRETIRGGFQWVKTYPSIPADVYIHLMHEAAAEGIKVCGHMSRTVDSKVLADLGYYSVEHSSSLPQHEADIEYLAKSGMWFCPTQCVCETLPDYVWDHKKLEDLAAYDYVPKKIRKYWAAQNESIIQGYTNRGLKPDINRIINRGRKFMQYSNHVLAGTDCYYPGIIAGFSMHEELEKMVTLYGQTPYQALKMATVNPAEFMGIGDQKGMLKKGMDADLLILSGNPLRDIANTRTIEAVIQGGRVASRTDLDSMLQHVKNMKDKEVEVILN